MSDVLALHRRHPSKSFEVKERISHKSRLRVVLEPQEVDVVDQSWVRAAVILKGFPGACDDECEVKLFAHRSDKSKGKFKDEKKVTSISNFK